MSPEDKASLCELVSLCCEGDQTHGVIVNDYAWGDDADIEAIIKTALARGLIVRLKGRRERTYMAAGVIREALGKVRDATINEFVEQVMGLRPSKGVTAWDRVLGDGEEVGS